MTSHVSDAVSIVHGPKGCTHHNFSLLHATWLDNGQVMAPGLFSTGLRENDIVFGGEKALERALAKAADRDVHAIFGPSTCIVDTIGDDVDAVCAGDYRIPVIHVPTAGFLGGTFQDGLNNALIALAGTAGPCPEGRGVNIIGEMNLEYEVGENYAEVSRLLSGLGLAVNLRFVHAITFGEFSLLGAARLNVLRDPSLVPVGEYLQKRFGTPFIASFPHGLSGTLSFIRSVADACGIDGACAADREKALQDEMIDSFSDSQGLPCRVRHYPASGRREPGPHRSLPVHLDSPRETGAGKSCRSARRSGLRGRDGCSTAGGGRSMPELRQPPLAVCHDGGSCLPCGIRGHASCHPRLQRVLLLPDYPPPRPAPRHIHP